MDDYIASIRSHLEHIPLLKEEDIESFLNGISRLPEGIQAELYQSMQKHKGFGEVLVGNFIAKKEAFKNCDKHTLNKVFEQEKQYLVAI